MIRIVVFQVLEALFANNVVAYSVLSNSKSNKAITTVKLTLHALESPKCLIFLAWLTCIKNDNSEKKKISNMNHKVHVLIVYTIKIGYSPYVEE